MIFSSNYVQPIASHRQYSERLLLRDTTGQCFLWFGDGREMEMIPAPLAEWMFSRPEMRQLQSPMLWFDTSSLPLSAALI